MERIISINSSDIQSNVSPKQKHHIIRCGAFVLLMRSAQEPTQNACVLDMGSHFASKAMGARSRSLRAKIFAEGEIPERERRTTPQGVVLLF